MSNRFVRRLGLQVFFLLLLSIFPIFLAVSCGNGDERLTNDKCIQECGGDDSSQSLGSFSGCGDSFFFSKACCEREDFAVGSAKCYCARAVSSRGVVVLVFIGLALTSILLFVIFMFRKKRSKQVDVANNQFVHEQEDHSGLDSANYAAPGLSSFPSDRPSNAQPPPGYPSGGISNHSTPHDSHQFSGPPNVSSGTAHHPQVYPAASIPTPPPHAPGSQPPYNYDSGPAPQYTSAPIGLYPPVAPLPTQPSAPGSHMVYHGTGQQW